MKTAGAQVRPGWQTPVVKSIDGSAQRVYKTTLSLRDEPLWFPDRRSLLFPVSDQTTGWTLYRLDLGTRQFQSIPSTRTGEMRLTGMVGESVFYKVNGYNPASTTFVQLTLKSGVSKDIYAFSGGNLEGGAVSPDGGRIAFAQMLGARNQDGSGLFILTLPDKSPVRIGTLTVRTNARAQLMWFPDGRSLLVSGRIGQDQGMWQVPINGDQPRRLQFDVSDITEIRMSPDAQWLTFTRVPGLPSQILAFNLAREQSK
jgi:Tol biopolymer transport system component